ncbi:flagellin [Roseateles microcysteis]|uniref:flagellin n=1 Tax=Roseateles microcysteis TaxID=3119057 RepID=UPI002FE699E0
MANGIEINARQLDQANSSRDRANQRIASGKRINSAADDAAGAAIAVRLSAQLSASSQLRRNVSDALSLTDTASGSLGQVNAALQRMRELALQANEAGLTVRDRTAIDIEYAKLSETLNQQATGTRYNGRPLLDGSFGAKIQTSEEQGVQLDLADVSAQGLGLDATSVTSPESARDAIGKIDQALAQVSDQQASIGAAQSALEATVSGLSVSYESLASTRSRRVDADLAAESSQASQATMQQQAALKAVSLYQQNQASRLELLSSVKA